ncbi:MAG: ferritin [Peptostreptococcaceae bacterium]|nr:ferritin [Peptostreptococcaceae bacterium]
MASTKMLEALNKQVQREFQSSYIYIGMESYFSEIGLDGFANFFHVQSLEERDHAYRLFNYINSVSGKVELETLEKPKCDYKSPLDALEVTLNHEKFITKSINELMDLAVLEKDHASISFLNWFVDEQVEEEESMDKIIKKLKLFKDDPRGLYMIDTELANRVFTPSTAE